MLWRITAAVTAIYFIHGAEPSRQDAARVASDVVAEAPRALVNACLDKPELCQQVLRHATGHTQGDAAPHTGKIATDKTATGKITTASSQKAQPIPVDAEEFPLPPQRPAMRHGRKGT